MEVWQMIFLNCLPTSRTPPCAQNGPLLLCQICRVFRKIAISMPTLWSSITALVSSSADARTLCRPKPELVDLWLCRSSACPLSISYIAMGTQYDGVIIQETKIFDIFMRHSSHWRQVYFLWNKGTTPLTLIINAPLLECARICSHSPSISFSSTPNLRQVEFESSSSTIHGFQLMFPDRQQLTNLQLTCSFEPNLFVEVLHQCPQLQSIRYEESTWHPVDPVNCAPVEPRAAIIGYFMSSFSRRVL